MKRNLHDLKNIIDLCKKHNITDLNLSYLIPFATGHKIISDLDNVLDYRDNKVQRHVVDAIEYGKSMGVVVKEPFNIQDKRDNRFCGALWHKIMINVPSPYIQEKYWLGNVSMSCKLALSDYGRSFGNLFIDDFESIWNGQKIQDMRRRLLTGNGLPVVCAQYCPYYQRHDMSVDRNYQDKLDSYISGNF